MEYVMLGCNERWSVQMDRLCEALDLDPARPSHRGRCWEAYCTYLTKWGGDESTDAGLFWGVKFKTLGDWAGWHEPERFGRALVKAGYVFNVEDKYPAHVLKGRKGFVHWGALDISWSGWHRKRHDKEDLVLFITDRIRRSKAALGLLIDPSKWRGWLLTREELAAMGEVGSTAAPPAAPHDQRPPGGLGPLGHIYGGGPAGPPPPREEHVERKNEIQRKHVKPTRARSGNPPSREQFQALRKAKSDGDPAAALALLDAAETSRDMRARAVAQCPGFVIDVISELTETWDVYRAVTWPPALVFSRISGKLRSSPRRDEARGKEEEGPRVGVRIGFDPDGAGQDDDAARAEARLAIQQMPGARSEVA